LDQRFYCDDEVFAADMQPIVNRKWSVAGHVDRVRKKGDYFLFKIGRESIIVIRSDESMISSFYNVCRHRGSLICTEPQGRVTRLTCGYDAWSYGLDGALLAARLMPADFSKKDNGLHRCHVRVFHGFIFVNLSDQARGVFGPASSHLRLLLQRPIREG
jgi:phenylpropionate dioxygenase-like ring-hydroxylating dioxygenase large terminal subunit